MTRLHAKIALVCTLGATTEACQTRATETPPSKAAQRQSVVDRRTQYELATAISAARRGRTPTARRFEALTKRWANRRYRWSVRYLSPLCQHGDRCRVLPFDHVRLGAVAQGWLPTLKLDAAQHDQLRAMCRSHQKCVIEFEGDLEITVADGLAAYVAFDDVSLIGSRSTTADESWIHRRPSRMAVAPAADLDNPR